ncbi:MAG TPA: tetratricopeptide repeat protein [Terrimicrobium sp.]
MSKIVLILFLASSAAGLGNSFDLRRAPAPGDRARTVADGWAVSRDALGAALVAAYVPGGPLRPGSTGVTAYRSWMSLWKWCEVLSRNERQEAASLLAAYLRVSPQDQKSIVLAPGYPQNSRNESPDVAKANQILSDQAAAEQFLRLLLPPDLAEVQDRAIAESLNPDVIGEWINDDELSRLLFEILSDHDYMPGVLKRLQELRLADPQKFKEYRALAVALAVVYDQRFPPFWPHRQVHPRWVPISEAPVAERFKFWTASNESRALLIDLRKLSPGQIKFIVDAPLAPSEFEWARKNVRYQRSEFAKAFDAVSYSFDRMKTGRFEWAGGEYTLHNIHQQTGICVDQAYYAMIAGKARGLPTLFFTGQGSDGGHAWFGYMKSDNRWELDCGRYKNQNYAVGQALDSQTWLPISDHELEVRAKGLREGLEFFSSRDDILMGRMNERAGEPARALKAYESAIQVCPQNEAGWAAKADFLRRTNAPLNTLKSHHEAALRQFATNQDMRVRQQVALAQIARQQGALQEAETMERQMVAQNKRSRSDLSVSVAAQKIISLIEANQLDKAFTEYRRQVLTLGRTGGGNFFYDIVQPFAEALVATGDVRQAKEVLALARKALKPEIGSIIDTELKNLEKIVADRSRG